MLLLRLFGGVLFFVGGWQVATGLRHDDDVTMWQGIYLIVGGQIAEIVRDIWRRQQRSTQEPGTEVETTGVANEPELDQSAR